MKKGHFPIPLIRKKCYISLRYTEQNVFSEGRKEDDKIFNDDSHDEYGDTFGLWV